MRRYLLIISVFFTSVLSSQELVPYFTSMPEDILPYLSVSQRKDMVDYKVANRPAIVKNLLGKNSELTFLSDRLLKLTLSDIAWFEMALFSNKKEDVVIATIQTTLVGKIKESRVVIYDGSWKRLNPLKYCKMIDEKQFDLALEESQRGLSKNSILIQRGIAYTFNEETLTPERELQFQFSFEKEGLSKDTILIRK